MGLFSPFVYKSKAGTKFWLHFKEKGNVKLYYFSKDPAGAMFNVPGGYEVIENETTHLPFLKKKAGGGLFSAGKKKEVTDKAKPDAKQDEVRGADAGGEAKAEQQSPENK